MESGLEPLSGVFGLPAWGVSCGYGSFLILEFGEPTLTIGTARERPHFVKGLPDRVVSRSAVVSGQWYLRIEYCRWTLTYNTVEIANSEIHWTEMSRPLRLLEGQALFDVQIGDDAGTEFAFDLGCTLRTRPVSAGTYGDDPSDQWVFRTPDGRVLALREDRMISFQPGNTPPDEQVFEIFG